MFPREDVCQCSDLVNILYTLRITVHPLHVTSSILAINAHAGVKDFVYGKMYRNHVNSWFVYKWSVRSFVSYIVLLTTRLRHIPSTCKSSHGRYNALCRKVCMLVQITPSMCLCRSTACADGLCMAC